MKRTAPTATSFRTWEIIGIKEENTMANIKHIHCPANGWDCPYYTDEGHPCRCTLKDPLKDCDDFGTFWEEGDDFIDDDWEERV